MKKFPAILFALCMLLALRPVTAHAEGQTIVHAGTVEELRSALADNTKIVLEGTDYSVGYLGVDGLNNVTIQGTEGTRILTEYEGNFALDIGNSDVVLEDISICLDPPEGSWHDTELFIVGLNADSRLTLRNCRITGCLLSCAIGEGCSLTVKDTVFSGCAQGIMDMCTGEALFENCTFSGSGFGREGKKPLDHAIAWRGSWGNDGTLAFVNCVFENNGNAGFMESEWETEGSYALQNCTFSNNRWGEAACPATPTSSTVLVNGEKTAFDAYSIDGNIFAFNPVMLLVDTNPLRVVQIMITFLAGLFGVAAALRGKLFRKMNPLIRLLLAAGGLCMMFPDTITDLVGLAVMVTACGFEYFGARKAEA